MVPELGRWHLCYRKSRDGNSGSTFHSKCNSYSNTIVVFKNNYNKIIGGTNVGRWSSSSSSISQYQMLFSLTLGKTFKSRTSSYYSVEYNGNSYGPKVSCPPPLLEYDAAGGACPESSL